MLYGRDTQRTRIAALIDDARDRSRSGALVLRGEAGIGKSALLDWAAEYFGGAGEMLRATGFEAETAIAFAGLTQLLWPIRDRLPELPGPQADALCGALGVPGTRAEPGDPFTSGLAVLTLLADLAENGPVLCLVDDAQWLDRPSAEALLFAARRLSAEGVVVLFATREEGFTEAGLPEEHLERLGRADAERLLAGLDLSPSSRRRVIIESRGNPLALQEFGAAGPRAAGGHAPLPVTERVLAAFRRQIAALPERTRLMLLLLAAEGRGYMPAVLGAAERFGVGLADLEAAEQARLVEVTGTEVAFRHPLIRSAAYQAAPVARRIAVHEALYHSADDPSCRARHRAASTTSPDEDVAAELAGAGDLARRQSGYATAAYLYRQAAALTPGRGPRGRRLLLAAEAVLTAADAAAAEEMAAAAERLTDDPAARARLAEVRAAVEHERGEPRAAARMLIDHAPDGDTQAMLRTAAVYAWTGGEAGAVRQAAALLDDGFLRGLALLVDDDPGGGMPLLAKAVADADRTHALHAAVILGADETARDLAAAQVARLRREGQVGALPMALQAQAQVLIAFGRHADARAAAAEAAALAGDTGFGRRARRLDAVLARLAAIEGDEDRLAELTAHAPAPGGEHADAAHALLELGRGRHEAALRRLEEIAQGPRRHTMIAMVALADLVEAAVRAGRPDRARPALDRFAAWARAGEQAWALGVLARCEGLLADAEEPFAEAVRRHERATRPFERARTELLYGEWLRRHRRRSDARGPLRSALEIFERLRAAPWAERARTELRATGEQGGAPAAERATAADLLDRLTPQERQVVVLAAEGISSREIAAQLFLSPRTVEYHLYKAYPKLGISSRRELSQLVPEPAG
ncbi:LuxR family transcriptional regulator [Actinomadura kijaniata]|uniref:helix-turn-helix transcriptional regulator n=1 Tax=Actinomadura kijaniata TaxID=46161 RepID=UPI002FE80FCC